MTPEGKIAIQNMNPLPASLLEANTPRQDFRSMPKSTVKISKGLEAEVPALLVDCLEVIFSNGLVEGIFRISGSARRMKTVTEDYGSYQKWLNSTERQPNVHDVGGIIKKYLRDYLDSINGLFPARVLRDFKQEYVSHLRKLSECSEDSFKSANTSLDSSVSLSSILEVGEEMDSHISNPESLVDALAHCLIVNNLESKNLFFIYWLSVMKRLSLYQDKTKMSVSNLSIIFQPYLFNQTNVEDLSKFRNILTFLVKNFDSFVTRFKYYEEVIGGLHALDNDCMSISSSGSVSASPLTIYSSNQGSPSKNTDEPRRKASISNRLSMFWDNYNLPANRSKRISFLSAKSSDRFASSDNLGIDSQVQDTHKQWNPENTILDSPETETPILDNAERISASPVHHREERKENDVRNQMDGIPQRPTLPKRNSKRKSFIEFFRSSLSLNSQENLSTGVAVSPLTPPSSSSMLALPKQTMGRSVDDLTKTKDVQNTNISGRKLLGRSISLRLKKK